MSELCCKEQEQIWNKDDTSNKHELRLGRNEERFEKIAM